MEGKMTTITVKGFSWQNFHHLPQHSDPVEIHGMTLRAALAKLRDVDYGDIGGLNQIELSDGTWIDVDCAPASEKGAFLMSSQRITRYEHGYSGWPVVVRRYSI
jgi:hypothetical protein